MELCKGFAHGLAMYAESLGTGADEDKAFKKYAVGFTSRQTGKRGKSKRQPRVA